MSLGRSVCLEFLYHKKPITAPGAVVLLQRRYAWWVSKFSWKTRWKRRLKFFFMLKVASKILWFCYEITKKMAETSTKKRGNYKWLSLEDKLEVIAMRKSGATFAKIASDKKMLESKIRGIFKKRMKSNLKVKTFILK